ncbi:MAG: hypothetical protein OK474_09425 [Thaumarchaeota archaeon]|nr:hypothetical protein [Nitrososphaerota archaeon]
MKPQDSRPEPDLSDKEISEYFEMSPLKPLAYPNPEFCELHDVRFIGKCHQCVGEAILTVESFEECNLGCLLPVLRRMGNEEKAVSYLPPHAGYQ